MALVNQDYISDCLAFATVLRVTQNRFRVDGVPAVLINEADPVESHAASDGSLPVKEPRRRRGQRSVSPSQSEETPTGNVALATTQEEVAAVAAACQPEKRKPDLLDDLMQKLKDASELVSHITYQL